VERHPLSGACTRRPGVRIAGAKGKAFMYEHLFFYGSFFLSAVNETAPSCYSLLNRLASQNASLFFACGWFLSYYCAGPGQRINQRRVAWPSTRARRADAEPAQVSAVAAVCRRVYGQDRPLGGASLGPGQAALRGRLQHRRRRRAGSCASGGRSAARRRPRVADGRQREPPGELASTGLAAAN